MKRFSISLIIREMQIKTSKRYHLTHVRMATINKSTKNKCWCGCLAKGTLVPCWWECRLVQPLWKTTWSNLKKLKMEFPLTQQFHCWELKTKQPSKKQTNKQKHPYILQHRRWTWRKLC